MASSMPGRRSAITAPAAGAAAQLGPQLHEDPASAAGTWRCRARRAWRPRRPRARAPARRRSTAHVVGQGVAGGQLHAARGRVERQHVGRHELGAAGLHQGVQRHADVVQRVVADHVAGQHAGFDVVGMGRHQQHAPVAGGWRARPAAPAGARGPPDPAPGASGGIHGHGASLSTARHAARPPCWRCKPLQAPPARCAVTRPAPARTRAP